MQQPMGSMPPMMLPSRRLSSDSSMPLWDPLNDPASSGPNHQPPPPPGPPPPPSPPAGVPLPPGPPPAPMPPAGGMLDLELRPFDDDSEKFHKATSSVPANVVDTRWEDLAPMENLSQYASHWQRPTADMAADMGKSLIPPNQPPPKPRLVLDLDHTLLCASTAADIVKHMKSPAQPNEDTMARAVRALKAFKMVTTVPELGIIIKLRPGLQSFLAACSEHYELCVYTHAPDERYVKAAIKAIDPNGTYIGDRVAHGASAAEKTVKTLTDIFPLFWGKKKSDDVNSDGAGASEGGGGSDEVVDISRILVVDDSVSVWPRHARNLVKCERYLFFPESARNFGHDPRRALFLHARDEVSDRGLLTALGKVMAEVAGRFREMWREAQAPGSGAGSSMVAKPDIRDAVEHVRKQVLRGCVLLFSAMLSRQQIQTKTFLKNRHYALAIALGAQVVFEKSNLVTHVVSANPGTDKCVWGRSTHLHVVKPEWLDATGALWKRADESSFALS